MRALLVALMLSLVLLPLAQAGGKTYRWTDDRGRVHYGDIAVPHSEQIEIRPGSGIRAAVPEAAALQPTQECQRLKDQLASYSSAQEITETDALGKTRSYTGAERQQLLDHVQKQVQEVCTNVPAP